MTTLAMPSIERRLLMTLEEQASSEPVQTWDARSLHIALNVLRQIRECAAEARKELEDELTTGVEARSFSRAYGQLLPSADEHLAILRRLLEALLPANDPSSQSLVAELRLLEKEETSLRNLLAEALTKASEPPRPVDWERFRAAEEAYERGETKPFSRR